MNLTAINRRQWLGSAAALLASGPLVRTFADQSDSLADLLRKAHSEHGLAALLAGVWRGNDQVLFNALGQSMTGVPAATDMHLRVGGVTLTSVCMALLRFVDQGRVKLDDPVSKWFPKLPESQTVTLRMLANCSAGYPDYVPIEAFVEAFERDPFRDWTAQELIDVAMKKPLEYQPGTGWNYSHTNFVILGEILQQIAKQPMAKILQQQIFEPLGLKHSDYPMTPDIRPPVLHAFSSERGTYEESTFWNPSWTSHTGRMTSTLGDLGTLAQAMGSDKLLSEKSRAEQVAPTTVGLGRNTQDLYYGLGIIMMNGWMVQNPRFGGYNLVFAHLPKQQISVVVATTMGPKCDPEVAYSTRVFTEMVKLLTPDTLIPEVVR